MGSPPPTAIASKLFVLSGLLWIMMTTACNKPAEVKSADTKTAEPVSPEITPPGWINPRITLLREPRIDLTGPTGLPDGAPDLVLEAILEPTLLREIGTWEIHANANLGHWTSAPNNHGWWPITTKLDTDQSNDKRSRIRLCFPDNNNPAISKLTVRALQSNGGVLFQQTIGK